MPVFVETQRQQMISFCLICCAGGCYGVLQTLAWHYCDSIFCSKKFNQQWWNPNISYSNKNLNNATSPPFKEKFFGSRTFLAWTTDAFHLVDKFFITAIIGALVLYHTWFGLLTDFCIYYLGFTICFEMVWRMVKKAK